MKIEFTASVEAMYTATPFKLLFFSMNICNKFKNV